MTQTVPPRFPHLLPPQVLMHLPHPRVCTAMDGPTVDVVTVLAGLQDKHADVTHWTEIHVLPDFVLDKTLVDKREEYPLDDGWK